MTKDLTRRTLLTTGFAAGAIPALGQDAEDILPQCKVRSSHGDWDGWSGSKLIPTGGDAKTLTIRGKSETFTAVVKSRMSGETVNWAGEARETTRAGHPWIAFENAPGHVEMSIQFGLMLDRTLHDAFRAKLEEVPGTAVFTADETEVARYEGITFNIFKAPINQDALLEIASKAERLRLDFYTGPEAPENLYSTQDYALAGLPDAFASLARLQEDHLQAVAESGDCNSGGGCAMTTAAVDMLGRNDDCFELTQMRRLRAAFPEYDWVIRDYLAASRQLLARPGLRLTLGLLVFYVLIVWPTALLVATGIRKPAVYLYLGGFGVLKRAMGVRPART